MTRNVVLLVLDTVRKDYFDENAPKLTELADISFEQCRSASSWSVPSHASILTGDLPHQHGINAKNRSFSELDRSKTFFADLPEHKTVGISANLFASTIFNFDRPFDKFYSVSRQSRYAEGLDMDKFFSETDEHGLRRYTRFLRKAIESDNINKSILNGLFIKLNSVLKQYGSPRLWDYGASAIIDRSMKHVHEEPVFLFANFMEAHAPHRLTRGYGEVDVPSEWTSDQLKKWEINNGNDISDQIEDIENYRSIYAAAIRYLDRKITGFIKEWQDKSDNETTFIITSDHGENLGYSADRELVDHIGELTEGLLHVPCYVINPPKGFDAEYNEYFSQIDLGELIVSLANEEPVDLCRDRIVAERAGLGIFSEPENYEHWNRMIRCAYTNSIKYQWDSLGTTERYELVPDRPCWQPTPEQDVVIPKWAKDLFDIKIDKYKTEQSDREEETELTDHVENRLDDLGYV